MQRMLEKHDYFSRKEINNRIILADKYDKLKALIDG